MSKNFFSKQFWKYFVIGASTTGLDFLLLYVFVTYLHLFYLIAASISIIIVFFINFSLNKYWTFESRNKNYFNLSWKYALCHAVGWAIGLAVLTLLVEIFGIWYLTAKVFATGVAFIWNYFVAKNWVFKSED